MLIQLDGIVRVVWLRLLCPGIGVLRIFEANISVERGKLAVLSMLKVFQDGRKVVSGTFVERRFVTFRICLSLVAELQQHVALQFSQFESLEEEVDAIPTQWMAKPGRPGVFTTQKLPQFSR